MRRKHNMLLAGVASLALLAGGGIAAAQQSPQGHTDAGAGMSAPSSAQKQSAKPSGAAGAGGMEQHAQTASPAGGAAAQEIKGAKGNEPSMARQGTDAAKPANHSAETNQKSTGQKANQTAQTNQKQLGENAKTNSKAEQRLGEKAKSRTEARERLGATEKKGQMRHERMGANTRSEDAHSRISERTKRNRELKGLQGNASIPMQGSQVNLTSNQRTRIRDTVIDARGAPRVGHVDFDVAVGTVVPRDRIHVVPVPETLVRIDRHWHGYLYFIVEDQVVIVNPRDMRIVAVLDV